MARCFRREAAVKFDFRSHRGLANNFVASPEAMLGPVVQRAGSSCSGYWAIKLHEVLPASKHCSGHGVCWKRKCYCQAEFGGRSCARTVEQPPSAAETRQTLRDLHQLSNIPHFRPPSPLLLMLSQPGAEFNKIQTKFVRGWNSLLSTDFIAFGTQVSCERAFYLPF